MLRALGLWALAHPGETIGLIILVASILNGLLPAKVKAGRLGRILHVVIDRLSATVRKDAPGTLKLPLVAGSLLRDVASALGPDRPEPPPPAPPSGQSGRSTVGAILVVLIAAVLTLLLALGLAVSGCDPSQHDPARYGTVTVYVSPAWIPADRARIGDELRVLQALGPAFVVTEASDQADVIVRPWESPDCATAGAGGHTLGTRVAEVDPVCAPGDGAFRAMVGHEIGHALGMLHVCRHTEDGPDCSPTVRGTPAMMARSPFVDSHDPIIGLVAVDTPQALDLAEYLRVRGAR